MGEVLPSSNGGGIERSKNVLAVVLVSLLIAFLFVIAISSFIAIAGSDDE